MFQDPQKAVLLVQITLITEMKIRTKMEVPMTRKMIEDLKSFRNSFYC